MLRIGWRVRGSCVCSTVITSAHAGHWMVLPTSRFDTRISAPHSQIAIWASEATAGGASSSADPAAVSKIAVSAKAGGFGTDAGGSSSNETTPSSFRVKGAGFDAGSPKTGRISVLVVPGICIFSIRIFRPQAGQAGLPFDMTAWTSTVWPQAQVHDGAEGPGGVGAGAPGFAAPAAAGGAAPGLGS